jgi:hypothetical protein
MSEWLTTGQMIDRLKIGEVAVSNRCNWYVTKDTSGNLYYTDEKGKTFDKGYGWDGWCVLSSAFVNEQWRILPRYVNFEEAMKALMNRKTVWLWVSDKKEAGYYIDKESGKLWAIVGDCTAPVEKIYFGDKWTIEDYAND